MRRTISAVALILTSMTLGLFVASAAVTAGPAGQPAPAGTMLSGGAEWG